MDFNQIFKMQALMEQHMQRLSGIEEDALGRENIFDIRFIALQVKVAELASTTKCYKYSKTKEEIPREKLLTRLVDAFRLLVSIGNVHGLNMINRGILPEPESDNIIRIFSKIYDDITVLKAEIKARDTIASITAYIRLFTLFMSLSHCLGFKFDDICSAYLEGSKHLIGEQ